MSGWEFLAITRSYEKLAKIPVLVTSGSQKAAETLAHAAVVGCLAKPIDLKKVLATVQDCARKQSGFSDEP